MNIGYHDHCLGETWTWAQLHTDTYQPRVIQSSPQWGSGVWVKAPCYWTVNLDGGSHMFAWSISVLYYDAANFGGLGEHSQTRTMYYTRIRSKWLLLNLDRRENRNITEVVKLCIHTVCKCFQTSAERHPLYHCQLQLIAYQWSLWKLEVCNFILRLAPRLQLVSTTPDPVESHPILMLIIIQCYNALVARICIQGVPSNTVTAESELSFSCNT